MNLYEKIKALYPSLRVEDFYPESGAIALRNDGDERGDYIAKWNHPTIERPTEAMLAAAESMEPSVPVPQSVTPAQGLMALYVLKSITEDDILAAINSIADPVMRYQALIAFKKATVWERESETMGVVAQLLTLTESDKDDLFTLGATYTNL